MAEAALRGGVKGVVILPVSGVKRFFEEGERLLKAGDVVQACEKIYKAAKDAVKVLVKTHAPEIYRDVESRGRWSVGLLDKGVRNLERELGEDVSHGWAEAWYLHVEGFHEERLKPDAVWWRLKHVKRLVELASNLNLEP